MSKIKKGCIIFDFNRTIYDPEKQILVKAALDIINQYKKYYYIALICKGDKKRKIIIASLNLNKYFDYIVIKDSKDTQDYLDCLKELGVDADKSWSIGDRIKKEILSSNKAGIKTIWFRQGKFSDEEPESEGEQPDFIVKSFVEIKEIIKTKK